MQQSANAPNEEKERPPRTLWGLLVLLTIVALGAFNLGWTIGRARIEDNRQELQSVLDQYHQAEKWKLPETIGKLNEAASNASLKLAERKQFTDCSGALQRVGAQLAQERDGAEKANAQLTSVRGELGAYKGELLEVALQESKPFAPDWSIGVKEINLKDSKAYLTVGDRSPSLAIGERLSPPVVSGSTIYYITLARITPKSCTFRINTH